MGRVSAATGGEMSPWVRADGHTCFPNLLVCHSCTTAAPTFGSFAANKTKQRSPNGSLAIRFSGGAEMTVGIKGGVKIVGENASKCLISGAGLVRSVGHAVHK